MTLLIFATALETPFPIHRFLSQSRSSMASFSTVEAPEGTAARPFALLSSVTSASIVGLPRESMICLPLISLIALIISPLQLAHHSNCHCLLLYLYGTEHVGWRWVERGRMAGYRQGPILTLTASSTSHSPFPESLSRRSPSSPARQGNPI